jgi:hypothetical protein
MGTAVDCAANPAATECQTYSGSGGGGGTY